MNIKIISYFIVGLIFFSPSTNSFADREKTSKDHNVSIAVKKIERSKAYPDMFVTFEHERWKYPNSGPSEDYFAIKITITRIESIHLTLPKESMPYEPYIIDKEGNKIKYKIIAYTQRPGQAKTGELFQGNTCSMLFKIPKTSKPEKLVYSYPYWVSSINKEIQYGEIVIDLLSNK